MPFPIQRAFRIARCGLAIAILIAIWTTVTGEPAWGCRYSVRDVAFVNVHGTPWQLQLVPPAGVAARGSEEVGEGNSWQSIVAEALADTNVHHSWLEETSVQGRNVVSLFDAVPRSQPCMALVDSQGMLMRIDLLPEGFAATIGSLVASPVRTEILDSVAEGLCVIVMVESNDPNRVAELNEIVQTAARQVNDQMWMLEKPTRVGPVVIRVPFAKQAQERWLLRSLEIQTAAPQPAVAIVFGQGRRLGPVLYGDEIQAETIVARASLCGRDCECDLDRRWLYGKQMIHRWSDERQRLAEQELDFDPRSGLVVAEVNHIIQSNRQLAAPDVVDLGPGLRIHDLDAVDVTDSSEREFSQRDVPAVPTVSEGGGTDVAPRLKVELRDAPGVPPSSGVPWRLIVALAGMLVMLTALAWFRATRSLTNP